MLPEEYKNGRRFLIRAAHGRDLIGALRKFCIDRKVTTAVFTVTGTVSSYTIGTYDPKQQVYVTYSEEAALEIAACSGILMVDANPSVSANIVLADQQGKTVGGRLFSDTIVYCGEMDIQELVGKPGIRLYDQITGATLLKD